MHDPRPGPDDLPTAARDRAASVLADLERDRADLAAAGEDLTSISDLIDAVRRLLDTSGPTGVRPP